jgi:hypothetical protein
MSSRLILSTQYFCLYRSKKVAQGQEGNRKIPRIQVEMIGAQRPCFVIANTVS